MKNYELSFFILSLCLATITSADVDADKQLVIPANDNIRELVTHIPSQENKYIMGDEETNITKAYVTALALDGMRRLVKVGFEFINKANDQLPEIERKKLALECAWAYALISNKEEDWNPRYVECVKATKQITGLLERDMLYNGIYIKPSTDIPDPKFFKKTPREFSVANFMQSGIWRNDWYTPGPLLVIFWALEHIGTAAIDFSKEPTAQRKCIDTLLAIILLIEARDRMGDKLYIAQMDQHLRDVQQIIEKYAKSIANQGANITNLLNLRLTEEGASKVGQAAFEEVNRAYGSSPIDNDLAKNLALFVLSSPEMSSLKKIQTLPELENYIDEVIAAYKVISDKYKELNIATPNIRLSKKREIALKTLEIHSYNDPHIFDEKSEAEPLKNAFKIGRILDNQAKTSEYDPEAQSAARNKERSSRVNDFKSQMPSYDELPKAITPGSDIV